MPLPDKVYCQLDHLIMNETEAAVLSGRKAEDINTGSDEELAVIASDFIKRGVRNVIITLGAQVCRDLTGYGIAFPKLFA